MRMQGRAWKRGVRVATVTIFVVCLEGLLGCGQVTGASQPGVISGDVVAGPTSPVERVGTPTATVPVTHRTVVIKAKDGSEATRATTDSQGHFSANVAPGDYIVQVAIVPGTVGMRQQTPGDVHVVAGQTTQITIQLDTGIR
jgi:hypothetical protein